MLLAHGVRMLAAMDGKPFPPAICHNCGRLALNAFERWRPNKESVSAKTSAACGSGRRTECVFVLAPLDVKVRVFCKNCGLAQARVKATAGCAGSEGRSHIWTNCERETGLEPSPMESAFDVEHEDLFHSAKFAKMFAARDFVGIAAAARGFHSMMDAKGGKS